VSTVPCWRRSFNPLGGAARIEGYGESRAEPIKNPVTGDPHRARIDLPHGFEYRIAEMASGSSTTGDPIPLNLENSFAQFNETHISQDGVIGQRPDRPTRPI